MLVRKQKTIAVSAAPAALALALIGCGGDDSSSDIIGDTGSGAVTVTAPGAPIVTSVTVGNTYLTIAFDPPSSNGGSAITSYDATCAGGGASATASTTASPVNVTGLVNGTEYSCTVTATNSAGTSSASNAAVARPDAPAAIAMPAEFNQFGNNVTVVYNEAAGTVTLEANGRPDHTTPYWDPNGTSGLYVAAGPETTVSRMSPGYIDQYSNRFVLTVSTNPQLASSSSATSLGAIGIAITGAPIFNSQEGPNVPLASGVISGFDAYGAHTGPQTYHYHLEPTPITNDDDTLFAILSDGFFLYGRRCASTGTNPTDLDASGGHVSATQYNDTPHYHYHIVNDVYMTVNNKDAYLLFDGAYQGTPRTITN